MTTFAIILCAIGLLVIPVGRMYSISQARKPDSKFSDDKYAKRYMNIVRIISLAICGIAILVISLIQ